MKMPLICQSRFASRSTRKSEGATATGGSTQSAVSNRPTHHFTFKNGQPKHYTRDRVDWFVKHYEEKVAIAEEEEVGEETELNRKSKLLYWLERQRELYKKLGVERNA